MLTAAPAFQRDEAEVFYYGFLSSRTSGALVSYLDTNRVSDDSKEVLTSASRLLTDILTAQQLFGQGKESVAPSETALDAYGCALEVIARHATEFDVREIEDLSKLFQTIGDTLDQLLSGGAPPQTDVRTTRAFFKGLAELMLAQLSAPEEEETSSF
ncbi:MAG TPA: hypothetical protein VL486_16825 [Verrucomicrobiae bacterium]|nr:hypothetical protein [Verrucomicrobiae bacterium]